ncbi:MAG: hypothetical protein CMM39_05130 [Rhodospirillaceae bacterium]|nr:hypothetical protein [Rhodospirillaceae bacterium]
MEEQYQRKGLFVIKDGIGIEQQRPTILAIILLTDGITFRKWNLQKYWYLKYLIQIKMLGSNLRRIPLSMTPQVQKTRCLSRV